MLLTAKKPVNKVEEVQSVEAAETPEVPEVVENNDESNDAPDSGRLNMKRRPNGCPYCDSSVYSYCSDKLLHDACCCLDPHGKFIKIKIRSSFLMKYILRED